LFCAKPKQITITHDQLQNLYSILCFIKHSCQRTDSTVATGAGHHSVIHEPSTNKYYIVYHRRPLGETAANHRVVCIDEMRFDSNGYILPVKMTK
jgi:hypothetical protein